METIVNNKINTAYDTDVKYIYEINQVFFSIKI